MSRVCAASTDWKTLPFGTCSEIPYSAEFSIEETERLKCGLIPGAMEDKWFVYCEDDRLYFFRSWTGRPVYQFELDEAESGTRVSGARIEDTVFELGGEDYHAALLNFLVSNLLLGKDVPFPMTKKLTPDQAELEQHAVSGSAFQSENITFSRPWWAFWRH